MTERLLLQARGQCQTGIPIRYQKLRLFQWVY